MTVEFTRSQLILGKSTALLMHAIRCTLTWHSEGLEDDNGLHWSCGTPVILAFWHSQQLLMPWIFREALKREGQQPIYALVSKHGDGRLAAVLLEELSIRTIAGSSSKGGMAALLNLARCIRAGSHVAITPDGPRGPKEEVKPGIIKLASLTGAPIVPVALRINRNWSFNSWDALVFPKPFAKVSVLMGDPLKIEQGVGREELTRQSEQLSKILLELNQTAQTRLK